MITILAAFFFSYYFVNIAGIPNAIKRGFNFEPGKRLKPLDCITCLSVWVAIILWFMPFALVKFICVIFGAGFIGNKIK